MAQFGGRVEGSWADDSGQPPSPVRFPGILCPKPENPQRLGVLGFRVQGLGFRV